MLIRTHTGPDNHDLVRLGEYSARMAAGDYDAVYEHWGGPHCMHGIGLVRTVGAGPHATPSQPA